LEGAGSKQSFANLNFLARENFPPLGSPKPSRDRGRIQTLFSTQTVDPTLEPKGSLDFPVTLNTGGDLDGSDFSAVDRASGGGLTEGFGFFPGVESEEWVGRESSNEPVEVSPQLPWFRESEIGECSFEVVLDSLVPDLKEIHSPIPILTFHGKVSITREDTSDDSDQRVGIRESSGKGFSWSRGLGCEISPIKTRSARKRAETILFSPESGYSSIPDIGVLRGMKSLARAKP
jgi:hypothetical protein